jgi:hypothetical protein
MNDAPSLVLWSGCDREASRMRSYDRIGTGVHDGNFHTGGFRKYLLVFMHARM